MWTETGPICLRFAQRIAGEFSRDCNDEILHSYKSEFLRDFKTDLKLSSEALIIIRGQIDTMLLKSADGNRCHLRALIYF